MRNLPSYSSWLSFRESNARSGAVSQKVSGALGRKIGYLDFCQRLEKVLEAPGIPNFSFFTSEGNEKFLSRFLREELEREKSWYNKLIKKDLKTVRYRDLSSDSNLDTVWSYLTYVQQSASTDGLDAVIDGFREEYANFTSTISIDRDHYRILKRVVDDPEIPEDERLSLRKGIREMEKQGVHLHPENKRKLSELYESLAVACRKYDETLGEAEDAFEFVVTDESDIAEMPESIRELAKNAAEAEGLDGYLFGCDPDSHDAVLKYCSNREIRHEYFKLAASVASEGDFDNRENALEIVRIQSKIAAVLWYPDASSMLLSDTMAKTREGVRNFIDPHKETVRKIALEEIESLRKFSWLDKIERWDVAYFARRQFEELSQGLTEEEFLPYFHFDRVLAGAIEAADIAFGVKFVAVDSKNLKNGIRHFSVEKDWKPIGYLIFDAFDREGKIGGSSATVVREKAAYFDVPKSAPKPKPIGKLQKKRVAIESPEGEKRFVLPVCAISCDFQMGESGAEHFSIESALTVFHEIGHVIHFLAEDSELPENSWFYTEADFIEIPSQLFEKWLSSPLMVEKYLVDDEWNPIDRERFAKYLALKKGFHAARGFLMDVAVIEADLDTYSSPVPVDYEDLKNRFQSAIRRESVTWCEDWAHYPTWFSHVFSGMYSSVYSSYLLGDFAVEDLFDRLRNAVRSNPDASKDFYDRVLKPGNKVEGEEILRSYLWRPANPGAYLKGKWILNNQFE